MITRLRVRNFKSLRDVDIAFEPLTILVGPNMGGKSNIVDVFYFIQQLLFPQSGADGLNYALAQRGGIGEVVWKGWNESLLAICLDGTDSRARESWSYELEVVAGSGGYAQIQKESFVVREGDTAKELIVLDGNTRWLANKNGQKLVSYSSGTRSALENVPENWDGRDSVRSVRYWFFYHLIPQLMRLPNPTGTGLTLERWGQNISAWLMTLQTRFPEVFRRLSEAAYDLLPELKALVTWPTPQGTVFLSSSERGLRQPVGIGGMSDGELAFLGLLSLVYSPPELGAVLYCVEEPENHLHPRLISALVRLMRQVREEVIAGGGELAQVILTTQSPLLVDEMTLDEVVWISKSEGQTVAIRPGDLAHLRQLVADKELGLGDIVYSGLLRDAK